MLRSLPKPTSFPSHLNRSCQTVCGGKYASGTACFHNQAEIALILVKAYFFNNIFCSLSFIWFFLCIKFSLKYKTEYFGPINIPSPAQSFPEPLFENQVHPAIFSPAAKVIHIACLFFSNNFHLLRRPTVPHIHFLPRSVFTKADFKIRLEPGYLLLWRINDLTPQG